VLGGRCVRFRSYGSKGVAPSFGTRSDRDPDRRDVGRARGDDGDRAAPPDAPRAPSTTPRVQQLLGNVLKTSGAPGGVAIVTDGSRTWQGARGLASVKTRAPMRVDHRFRVASITKMFVAVVVLQLAAEGRLRLDDPVERWAPGGIAGGDQITVRHLLSHTSGLVNGSAQVPPGAFTTRTAITFCSARSSAP